MKEDNITFKVFGDPSLFFDNKSIPHKYKMAMAELGIKEKDLLFSSRELTDFYWMLVGLEREMFINLTFIHPAKNETIVNIEYI